MAIEIIKRGEDPGQVMYETTCERCGTVFRAEWEDFTPNVLLQRNHLDCPECEARIYQSAFHAVGKG